MLKRICKKKIIISSIILFLVITLNLIPTKNDEKINITNKINYVNYELSTNEIFLLDKNNYLNRVKISTENINEELVYEIIDILTCGSKKNDKIPNGLKCIIPKKAKLNSVSLKNNTIKIDFNNEFLNVKKELEEKLIESIVYSLTSIENIDNVLIYIDGNILNKLPQNNIIIPNTLNRDIGINKKYELTNTKNIKKTTIYYVNIIDKNTYYTPVTLINNDNREKIEIIIDELSNKILDNNLNSYLNNDTKVLNSSLKNNTMHINFNENILDGIENNNILEEVIYTISLSINDNYDIKNVFFDVNNKEIVKTTIKSLE